MVTTDIEFNQRVEQQRLEKLRQTWIEHDRLLQEQNKPLTIPERIVMAPVYAVQAFLNTLTNGRM